jgi:hypothetical protein
MYKTKLSEEFREGHFSEKITFNKRIPKLHPWGGSTFRTKSPCKEMEFFQYCYTIQAASPMKN